MLQELSSYYDTFPQDITSVLARMEAVSAENQGIHPCLLKSKLHQVISEECGVRVFRRFPFYFEIESGRLRYEWGFGPLGCFLYNRTKPVWLEPFLAEIAVDKEDGVMHAYSPFSVDHHCAGYDNVLRLGLSGLDEIAREKLAAETDADRQAFYQAVLMSNEALRRIMKKFSAEAERMLLTETDPEARKNLLRVAEAAREVPDRPPRTFYEAINTLIFLRETYGTFEGIGISTFGQIDRMLAPYYEADLAAGRITYEEAKHLVDALLLYTEGRFKMKIERVETSTTIIIGGCDRDGNVVFNDITRMVLDSVLENRCVGTKINARISPRHPAEYLDRLARVLLAGVSVLVMQNDDTHIAGRVRNGFDIEDARLYVSGGCHETVVANAESNSRADTWISLPGLLLRMLKGCGEFTSFDDFYAAYIRFVKDYCDQLAAVKNRYEALWSQCSPTPMYSASLTGCLESGRDMTAGGAKYNSVTPSLVGIATIIDSLYAIDEVVFRKKQFSLAEFTGIIRQNFEGHEALRRQILKSPKFGTNNAALNDFGRRFLHDISSYAGQTNARGGKFLPGIYPHDLYIPLGIDIGATPDGRLSGQYLSRGVAPSEFVHTDSPLDIIGSLSALDLTDFTESIVTDLTLPAMPENGCELLTSIMRAFMQAGGSTLQINLVDPELLRLAQKEPEHHEDVIVRICGYSEKFVALNQLYQEEFIARTIR